MVWEKTPFTSIEQAHTMAEKMGLQPSVILNTGSGDVTFRSFNIREGRKTILIAQNSQGGPVLEREMSKEGLRATQDPDAPRAPREEELLRAGSWQLTQHKTLKEANTDYRKEFINPDEVEMVKIILFRHGDEEYEYAQDSKGVWARVLYKPPRTGGLCPLCSRQKG